MFFFCASLQAQDMSLEVEYLFTVGEDLEFGEPGYLYNPVGVSTDSHGNIIVADHRGRAIHKYTPDGKYLQSVGAQGRGPGEFNRITEIAVDENDNLLVLDRFQFKVAKFNMEAGSVEEFIYKDMPDMTTMTLAPLKNDKFATIYVGSGVPGSTDVTANALRVYELGEEENISSHFPIFKYQFDNKIPIEENMGRTIGHKLISVDGNRVVAGHTVYKGNLF
nr:6-bladed beta-propeller [Rhodohalobacter sp. SW132]